MPVERINTVEAIELFGEDAIPLLEEKLTSLGDKLELKEEILKVREELYKLKLKVFLKFNPIPFSKIGLIEPLFKSINARDLFKANEELDNLRGEYRRIKFALISANQWKDTGKIECLDVESAKNFPIEQLIQGEIKGHGNIKHAFCPFHEEKNPSFCLYIDTNSYYCFSCKEGGDVIDLCMKLKKISFREAVEFLT